MKSRIHLLPLCFLVLGCGDETNPATQLVVSIDAGPALAARLVRLEVTLHRADAKDDRDPLRTQPFALTTSEPRGMQVKFPFSFGVAKGAAERIKLVVKGFESESETAEPVVERKVVAAFKTGVTRAVEIVLSDVCADHVCSGIDLTCAQVSRTAGAATACVDVTSGELSDAGTSQLDAAMNADTKPTNSKAQAGASSVATQGGSGGQPAAAGSGGHAGTNAMPTTQPANPGLESTDADGGATGGACSEPNACDSVEYPCVESSAGGYTCLGQFADWPMPDTVPGVKVAASYDYSGKPGVVIDRVTSLNWQRTPPRTFAGCSGNESTPGDGCTWPEAKAYCAQLNLDGGGWRVPSKIELESIIGDTKLVPPVDPAAFPDLSAADVFWTVSTTAGNDLPGWAWVVRSGLGMTLPEPQTMQRRVRCVRGSPNVSGTPRDRYKLDAATETVTDTRTQLVWQRQYSDTDTLDQARAACSGLGGGWRLPGVKELLTLIDPTRFEPAVDPVFPKLPIPGLFWTATPVVTMNDDNLAVDMTSGMSSPSESFRTSQDLVRVTFHTRCVR